MVGVDGVLEGAELLGVGSCPGVGLGRVGLRGAGVGLGGFGDGVGKAVAEIFFMLLTLNLPAEDLGFFSRLSPRLVPGRVWRSFNSR